MKHLPLKLGVGVVLLFVIVITACLLWTPVRYRRQRSRLRSDNAAVREKAIASLAAAGPRAVPHLRRWLHSENEKLVTGACRALGKIKGDSWQEALPELETILSRNPSETTDAVAAVVYGKGFACEPESGWKLKWKHFSKQREIRRNICIHILAAEEDSNMRARAAYALGKIGDARALEPLITALGNDSHSEVRECVASALGKIGDIRAVEPLITALGNDSHSEVRKWAAGALGTIGDTRAVEPLITALENDSSSSVRRWAAGALGAIGDARALEPLITALGNDSDPDVREYATVALAGFEGRKVDIELADARENGDPAAAIALGWHNGGGDLERVARVETDSGLLKVFLADAQARWGNAGAVGTVINDLPSPYLAIRRFHADVFARMPEGFPAFDFKANYAAREKQAKLIKKWFKKNRGRLAWDAVSRKYYLRKL